MNIVEPFFRRALMQPDAPALISGDRVVTYGRLMNDVITVADRLCEEGVRPKDVVALVAVDLLPHVLFTLAIARVGAISVPVWNDGPLKAHTFADQCGAAFVVHNKPAPLRMQSPDRKQLSLQDLAAVKPTIARPTVMSEPSDAFRISFSSGTTGRPKPIAFTHGAMLLRSALLQTMFPVGPSDRTMIALGLGVHFASGYWFSTLFAGGTVVGSAPDPAANAKILRSQEITFLVTSPSNAVEFVKVAQSQSEYSDPPSHLKTLCIGGGRVAPALQTLFRRHICENLHINYGVTEAGGLVASADPALQESQPGSAGRLLPWVEAQALDDEGAPLPPGSPGLLRIRSPYLATGYLGEEQGAGAFRDGWFYSADSGMVTSDGVVFLGGRADVLNLGGTKVNPERIEAVIAEDPAVLECVALAIPDVNRLAQVVAVVVAPKGFDRNALQDRCLRQLGPAFTPKAVYAVDSLPHNAGGKVQRQKVPALVKAHLAQQELLQNTPSAKPH
jgi:acyl-coenzyme A synthetase/AMP-(fatty) acid ligase